VGQVIVTSRSFGIGAVRKIETPIDQCAVCSTIQAFLIVLSALQQVRFYQNQARVKDPLLNKSEHSRRSKMMAFFPPKRSK
jgi:hypothetical protein